MAKVIGLGGIFFKARDPAALRQWYQTWLGIAMEDYGASLQIAALPAKGYQVLSPFSEDTDYFAPSHQRFMINLMVDDLAGCLQKLADSGAQVMSETESGEFGDFGWFMDPEGNKVELWQPPAAD